MQRKGNTRVEVPPHGVLRSVTVTTGNIDRLRVLGVLDILVGKWPIGNTSIDEVVNRLRGLLKDPHVVMYMTYRYPHGDGESHDTVRAELAMFTLHLSWDQNKYIDIMELFLL